MTTRDLMISTFTETLSVGSKAESDIAGHPTSSSDLLHVYTDVYVCVQHTNNQSIKIKETLLMMDVLFGDSGCIPELEILA